jgi:DNA-binding MarR family transcriptional regulator
MKKPAAEVADLTFQLLAGCRAKEERFSKQLSLFVPEFRCLRAFRGEQQVNIKTLVERMNVSGSRLTRILDGLSERGFLTRAIAVHDRRGITVTLSPKGIALSKRLEESYVAIHEEILRGIPKDQHATLVASLERLLTSLEQWLRTS